MAVRHFTDGDRRFWTVWDVSPTLLERRRENTGPPAGNSERRHHVRALATLPERMANGWLAFKDQDGERRRLAPIPSLGGRWFDASEQQLSFWCEMAARVIITGRLAPMSVSNG